MDFLRHFTLEPREIQTSVAGNSLLQPLLQRSRSSKLRVKRSSPRWRPSHNAAIDQILRKARAGTRVIYVPGNHDEALRPYVGHTFAGIEVIGEAIHETADGRRLLVIHGDHFDGVVMYWRWLAYLGDWAYATALRLNDVVAGARRCLGLPYWSLSRWLKNQVKNAVEDISRFENAVVREAQHRRLDGVVCAHIHKAEMRQTGGILYCNDGDWVESCTALVEDYAGRLQIVAWTEAQPAQARAPLAKATA